MGVAAENERLKYHANFLSNVSVVVASTGALAPIIGGAVGSNLDAAQNIPMMILIAVSLVCAALIYAMGVKILQAVLDD